MTFSPPGEEDAAPRIVGFLHRFADPEVERRYCEALAPQAQRRLMALVVAALCMTLTRLAAPELGLLRDTGADAAMPARIAQVLVSILVISALRTPRRWIVLEMWSACFALAHLGTRCWLLPTMSPDGSVALVVGTVPLLYFGSPLRIGLLCPIIAAGSIAMMAAWTRETPAPGMVAIFQVLQWLVVLNLLGLVAMRLMRFTLRRQWSLSEALRHQAMTDALTGIANRRRYDVALAGAWQGCAQDGRDISLVLIDVDHFKQLNDRIGHEAGDACLCQLAALLTDCVQASGTLVARTGGEEFACVLPGLDGEDAGMVAERIVSALRQRRMPHPDSPIGPHVTLSLGVASAHPGEGRTLSELTSLADRLMYEAKNRGRDRVARATLGGSGTPPAREAA